METKRNGTPPQRKTMNAHYLETFYQRHPERRKEYRLRYSISLLEKAGYTVTAPAQDRPQAAAV